MPPAALKFRLRVRIADNFRILCIFHNSQYSAAAESPDGSHGSTFIVHLPLGCAHLPPHQVDESILLDSIGTSKFTQSILEEATTWVQDEEGLSLSLVEGASSIKLGSDRAMGAYSSEIGETQVDGLTTLFWSKVRTPPLSHPRFEADPLSCPLQSDTIMVCPSSSAPNRDGIPF